MKTRALTLAAVLLCMPFGLFAQKQEEISPTATQQDIEKLQKDINAQRQEQKKANNRFADGLKGVAGSVERLGKDTRDTKSAINGAEKNLGDKIDGVKTQGEEQTKILDQLNRNFKKIFWLGVGVIAMITLVTVAFILFGPKARRMNKDLDSWRRQYYRATKTPEVITITPEFQILRNPEKRELVAELKKVDNGEGPFILTVPAKGSNAPTDVEVKGVLLGNDDVRVREPFEGKRLIAWDDRRRVDAMKRYAATVRAKRIAPPNLSE